MVGVLLEKKNSTLFAIYVHFALSLKLVRREHLKIFLDVPLGFFGFFAVLFLCFVFFFFFCATWKVVCLQFRMFLLFFLFKISCWDIFIILGVHHSRVRGSPMWCLKFFFCVEVTNVGFEGF